MSTGDIPAISNAFNDAWYAKSEVASPLEAICRSLIPVRVIIHSSLVSTMASKSLLVSTFSGTCEPVPIILALYMRLLFPYQFIMTKQKIQSFNSAKTILL